MPLSKDMVVWKSYPSLSFRPIYLRGLDCRKFRPGLSELGGRLASAVRRMHALEPTAWLCVQSMDAEALTRRPEDPEGLCSPGTTIQTYVPSVSQSLLASPLSGQTADGG